MWSEILKKRTHSIRSSSAQKTLTIFTAKPVPYGENEYFCLFSDRSIPQIRGFVKCFLKFFSALCVYIDRLQYIKERLYCSLPHLSFNYALCAHKVVVIISACDICILYDITRVRRVDHLTVAYIHPDVRG